MFRTLMVPLDASEYAEHALPMAVSLARRSGARVEAVHVHSPLDASAAHFEFAEQWEQGLRDAERQYLESLRQRLWEVAGYPLYPVLLEAPVLAALSDYVKQASVDLVVMTTHGRGGLVRGWLGSVADRFVRQANVPVMLVKPQSETQPEIGGEVEIRNVLVPLDGSELAEQVLAPALRLCTQVDAGLTLLRVVQDPFVTALPYMGSGADEEQRLVEERSAEAEAYLDGIARRFRRQTHEISTIVATRPDPAQAILAHAQAEAVDLIALASHARGGLSRLVLGSVADKVLRGSTKPVLLVRPEEKEQRHKD